MVCTVDDPALRMLAERNPEAAMVHAGLTDAQLADCLKNPYTKHQDLRVHQPSAAFIDHPHDWEREANALNRSPSQQVYGHGTGDSAHGIELPGFDSEAHRAFMRGLG